MGNLGAETDDFELSSMKLPLTETGVEKFALTNTVKPFSTKTFYREDMKWKYSVSSREFRDSTRKSFPISFIILIKCVTSCACSFLLGRYRVSALHGQKGSTSTESSTVSVLSGISRNRGIRKVLQCTPNFSNFEKQAVITFSIKVTDQIIRPQSCAVRHNQLSITNLLTAGREFFTALSKWTLRGLEVNYAPVRWLYILPKNPKDWQTNFGIPATTIPLLSNQ